MTSGPFVPILEARGLVVLDGGLATALEDQGYLLADELWSSRLLRDDPEAIAMAHRRYLDAGADCITTASYQASYAGFAAAGFAAAGFTGAASSDSDPPQAVRITASIASNINITLPFRIAIS